MTEHPPYRVASFYASSSALFLRVESRAGFVEIRYVKRAEEGLRVFECVSPLLRRFLTARSADAGPIFSPGDRSHFSAPIFSPEDQASISRSVRWPRHPGNRRNRPVSEGDRLRSTVIAFVGPDWVDCAGAFWPSAEKSVSSAGYAPASNKSRPGQRHPNRLESSDAQKPDFDEASTTEAGQKPRRKAARSLLQG
jgi:hypothetical protein